MTRPDPTAPPTRSASPMARVQVWHLALLVAFVAIAITDIRNHRRTEPFLIALAGIGFAAYWALGWLGLEKDTPYLPNSCSKCSKIGPHFLGPLARYDFVWMARHTILR
jgi:hypothetical protein